MLIYTTILFTDESRTRYNAIMMHSNLDNALTNLLSRLIIHNLEIKPNNYNVIEINVIDNDSINLSKLHQLSNIIFYEFNEINGDYHLHKNGEIIVDIDENIMPKLHNRLYIYHTLCKTSKKNLIEKIKLMNNGNRANLTNYINYKKKSLISELFSGIEK